MGTNWYVEMEPDEEDFHIGKSSGGWCFALHVIRELGLNTWEDWVKFLTENGYEATNEYGRTVTLDYLVDTVTNRQHPPRDWLSRAHTTYGYSSEEEFHKSNNSMPGPNGLVRAKVDGVHCVGHHPTLPIDYITGEFS